MKAINFYAKHGLKSTLINNSQEFDKAWHQFLLEGEELPTKWPETMDIISIM